MQRAVEYGSHEELAAVATLVVITQPVEGLAPVDVPRDEHGFYYVPMVVDEVLKGDARAADTYTLRTEVGLPGEEGTPLVMSDRPFLLYLQPLEFGDGRATSEWVVVGYLAGYYERLPDRRFRKVDPESPSIPLYVDHEQVREAVRAS